MELLHYNINIIVLFLIAINCVSSFSVEPKYTKFEYEKQLLEKVVRFEVNAENLNNAIIVNDTKQSTEKEIRNGNDRMDLMKSEIEDINQNVTSTMAQEQQSIRDFQELLNKTLETKTEELTHFQNQLNRKLEIKSEELTRFEEDLNKKFKAKTEELKQYEEQMNKNFETQIEELTRLEEQLNQKFKNKTEELTRLGVSPLIAFNARNGLPRSYQSSGDVVFEVVRLNEGGCYDKTTGHFTASVDGIYQFSAQLCFLNDASSYYEINVGSFSWIKGRTWGTSNSTIAKCNSFSVTTRVNKGEHVRVTAYDAELDNDYNHWNFFSGSIIGQF